MPLPLQSSVIIPSSFTETRRLHITPLTATLLPKVLGNLLPLAQDISFHSLPNFPNRDYGFLTLPVAEAAMVKKRLHGTILRGEKIAIDDARPDTRKEKTINERQEGAEAVSESEPQGRTLRKRKRENGVIPGAVELPEGRRVSRGWTEPKAEIEARKIKDKREKKESKSEKKSKGSKAKSSAFTDKKECLFQTTVPHGPTKNDKKDRQDRKKSKKGKEVVTVHEFANNTKHPSYLRHVAKKDTKSAQEYIEGKGWMDEEGNIVEAAIEPAKEQKAERKAGKRVSESLDVAGMEEDKSDNETSSSGNSSESDEDDEDDKSDPESETMETRTSAKGKDLRISTEPEVSIIEPSPITPHPLETLFKKPKPPTSDNSTRSSLEINTSFSFFGGNTGDEDIDRPAIEKSLETPGIPALKRRGLPNLHIPVTPYSQRDMQFRRQRSAAPTPDTAAPSKSSFGDPFGMLSGIQKDKEQAIEEEKDDDEQDDIMEGIEGAESSGTQAIHSDAKADGSGKDSDFTKWFWENRGANTRAWKKRKREATKEQRNRESRRRKD